MSYLPDVLTACPACGHTTLAVQKVLDDGWVLPVLCINCAKLFVAIDPVGRYLNPAEVARVRRSEIDTGGKGRALQEAMGRDICPND